MAARDHFRSLARRSVSLSAILRNIEAGWQSNARIVDLGLGGACLEVERAVTPGSGVSLQVLAPNLWDPLVLEAKVAWCRNSGSERAARVGLSFAHRSSATLRALVELLGAEAYE
jgi:Tfp pilus assembly protein PilZ